MAQTRPQRMKTARILICFLGIVLLALGGYLYLGWRSFQEAPKLITIPKSGGQITEPYQLSSAQEDVLFSRGYPDAFTILFYEEETVGGPAQTNRLESWDYYNQGIGLTFLNGELTAEDPIEGSGVQSVDPLPYFPEQFAAFMSFEEVIAAAGLETYVEIPLDKDLMTDGQLYYGPALAFGIQDNQLRYLEVLALSQDQQE